MVVDRVLQNALEEHRQLGRGLGRVFLGQLQHRVLHDVQRGILVADREHRLLEGTALDLGQEGRHFLCRSQVRFPGQLTIGRL